MSESAGDAGALHDPTTHRGLHRRVPAALIVVMDKLIEQHADRISGTLGCFDRMLFRGYLPIMSGAAMAGFLKSRDVRRETLKAFLLEQPNSTPTSTRCVRGAAGPLRESGSRCRMWTRQRPRSSSDTRCSLCSAEGGC